jgi:hypothetical protein
MSVRSLTPLTTHHPSHHSDNSTPDTLHYIIIAFSFSTIAFAAFTVDQTDVQTRADIVLTVLLTVVAFNYVCQDKIPKVSCALLFRLHVSLPSSSYTFSSSPSTSPPDTPLCSARAHMLI